MPQVKFHGFSEKHQRNLITVDFDNERDAATFEINFKMNFGNREIIAERKKSSTSVDVVFITGLDEKKAMKFITNVLNCIKG